MIRATLALFLLAPAQAGAFDLAFPLDCTLGETCFIQQYTDHDPGPAASDFTCGPLSYDTHDGTDIALPSLAAMQAGVTVRAASPGIVKGARDGMADIAANAANAPDITDRECGNGVLIEHADGWKTQYCHMKQGSITVRAGDPVALGAPLGQVGISGMAEFPHLHLTIRHNGYVVDPFATDPAAACGAPAQTLWSAPVPYQPGGLISIGLASEVPEYAAIQAGLPPPNLTPTAPALVVWAYLFGGRAGDTLDLSITGPDGVVIQDSVPLEKTQAQLFRAIGKRLRAAAWPPGPYSGTARLLRDGTEIDLQSITIQLGN
ncbi:MAG: M23 family metallopeptidase [Paracoccaceae bacterium]